MTVWGFGNDYQAHVVQDTMCRFVCVRCTDMIQSAFEGPDLGQCFKHHVICVKCLEIFLQTHEGQEVNVFSARSSKIQKFRMEKKVYVGGQNDLKMIFDYAQPS